MVITYYWPPSGGPGVQRVLKFCKYLPEFGWEPIVLTVKDGEYPNIDISLEKEVEELGIRVIKTNTYEPFTAYKWLTRKKSLPSYELNKSNSGFFSMLSKWIRINYFIPDARKGWIPYGVKAGKELLNNENIDIIFSSGPPHSLHFIAKKLKEISKIPWVADFRDPWTDLFYYDTYKRVARALNKDIEMEKEILNSADFVTTVSNGTKELLNTKVEDLNAHVIHNGFDPEDFTDIEIPNKNDGNKIITYIGSMSESQVSEGFFRAVSDLIHKNGENIIIRFIGNLHQRALDLIKEYNLESYTDQLGYCNHCEVIIKLFESDLLLLVIPNTKKSKLIITGKLYEYLKSEKPILAIANLKGDAAKIIDQTHSGSVYQYDDVKGIKNFISQNQHQKPIHIDQFSRRELTKELDRVFVNTAG